MCTSPNFIRYNNVLGIRTQGKMKPVEFVPHVDFDEFLKQSIREGFEFIPIPCGHCLECRRAHAQEWADRCTLEARQYKDNYFITLTYDDEHLPSNGCQSTLRKKDFQDFMKRLRKQFDCKIKVFYCGEYGDQSSRPHMHAILFNLPLSDLSYEFKEAYNHKYHDYDIAKEDKEGNVQIIHMHDLISYDLRFHLRPSSNELYYSETIHKAWLFQGNISVARFSYATAAYVAQYVDKKVAGKSNSYYKKLGIEPEFIGMSKGLGVNGYDKKLFVNDIVYVPSFNADGEKITKKQVELQKKKLILPATGSARVVNSLPRYFLKNFEKDFPKLFLKYKAAKKADLLSKQSNLLHKNTQQQLDIRARKNKLRFCLSRSAI